MCEYCEKIFDLQTVKKFDYIDQVNLPSSVIAQEGNKNYIYAFCDDTYYSGIIIRDVNYCPRCGRDLKSNTKIALSDREKVTEASVAFSHSPEDKWVFTITIPDINRKAD